MALAAILAVPAAVFAQDRATPANRNVTVVACVVQEADYVRTTASDATAPAESQLLLAHVQTGLPTYSLAGTRESELRQYVGQRVEISGRVEPARTTPVLTTADGSRTGSVKTAGAGASGTTPDGAAAHEPSDALSATVPVDKVPQPARNSDPAYQVATIPRLNASAFRPVGGACPAAARQAATRPADATAAQPAVPARTPQVQPSDTARRLQSVTARGCLARQTANGTALTPAADRADPLVLMKATIVRAAAVRTSVPGGSSSSSGSGTLPDAVATSGAPVDAGTLSFVLDVPAGQLREISQHVGERVEIVGMTPDTTAGGGRSGGADEAAAAAGANDTGRVQPAPVEPAHPSAAGRSLALTAFRAIGGTCN